MKRTALLVLATAALSAAGARQAQAQSGFALKGHFIVNSSNADEARANRDIPVADGFERQEPHFTVVNCNHTTRRRISNEPNRLGAHA